MRTVYIVVAAVPPIIHVPQIRIPVPGIEVRMHPSWSRVEEDHGKCTGEAGPYLRAMATLRTTAQHDDLIVFMHDHRTTWHQPVEMGSHLTRLLTQHAEYMREPYGQLYCFSNQVMTVNNTRMSPNGITGLWNTFFNGTQWDGRGPKSKSEPQFYPCCGTFFVQGSTLKRHTSHAYLRVIGNMARACRDTSLVELRKSWPSVRYLAAQTIEGWWHLMLTNNSHVPPAAWCQSQKP